MKRILVLRGGAVGDLIVTLPALGALRQAFPAAWIEVLGIPSRAILARHPRYANAVVDQERWDVYRLFRPQLAISAGFATYLHDQELVLAYLAGEHEPFGRHVRQLCSGQVRLWNPHPPAGEHATTHLLRPVTTVQAGTYDPLPRVYLDPMAVATAERFWQTHRLPRHGVIAWHPGSGGAYKLWPMQGWQHVMTWAAQQGIPGLLVSGPAEQERLTAALSPGVSSAWPWATQLALPQLAALLARCRLVISHDSGVAHLAAAVGTPTVALFGPTDPLRWAPRHPQACVLRPAAPGPLTLANMPPEFVVAVLDALYQDTFVFTPSAVDCTMVDVPPTDAARG